MSTEIGHVVTNAPSTVVAPMNLIELAVSKGSDPDHLEKLMNLQERWEATQARKAFFSALGDFQDMCPDILKTAEVSFGQGQKRTEYKFAKLPEIIKAIRPALKACGLTYRWEIDNEGDQINVTCIVTHEDGHSERTTIPVIRDDSGGKNKIQGVGSGVTYGQRYSLIGALGLTTADADDDGGKPAITVDELLDYNAVVRDNWKSIAAIKEALAAEAWDMAAEAVSEIRPQSSEPIDSPFDRLWRAPSKGGIWTTEERKQMGSAEFLEAMKARSE